MAREGCIAHPPGSYFTICRESYLALCDGDIAAATLLSIFEVLSDYHYQSGEESEEIWLQLGAATIRNYALAGFSEKIIRRSITFLVGKGLISRAKRLELVSMGVLTESSDPGFDAWVQDWFFRFESKLIQERLNEWAQHSQTDDTFKPQYPVLRPHGWVYLIRAGIHIKIGWTRHLENRVSVISAGLTKGKAELIHSIECARPERLESFLHKQFKENCVGEEWFLLSAKEIKWIKSLSPEDVEQILGQAGERK